MFVHTKAFCILVLNSTQKGGANHEIKINECGQSGLNQTEMMTLKQNSATGVNSGSPPGLSINDSCTSAHYRCHDQIIT
jgi:hypothetical protein